MSVAATLLDEILDLLSPEPEQGLRLVMHWESALVDRFADALRSGGTVKQIEAAVRAAARGLAEEGEQASADALVAMYDRLFGGWRPVPHSRVA